jgi:diacylglycerol kinase (ATP)
MVLNPRAGSADVALVERAAAARRWDVVTTERAGQAGRLARAAAREGVRLIVVAGGDGTVNEVVTGLGDRRDGVVLALLPLGTGNDLARTLGIPLELEAALEAAAAGPARRIDLVRVRARGRVRLCVNVAAGGFSARVDQKLTPRLKERWGPLSYVRAAASAIVPVPAHLVRLRVDGQVIEEEVVNVFVANGRSCAGGLLVAPDADVEDGLADVVLVRAASVPALGAVAARFLTGTLLESDLAVHRRAREVRVAGRPRLRFNVDGELLAPGVTSFKVLPRALRIRVGPGYRRPRVTPRRRS